MQETSELYKQIVSEEDHGFETALSIGDDGRLITQSGETITFGGVAILVDTGGPETAFQEDVLWDVSTIHRAFSEDLPEAGGALSGEINVKMLKPVAEIPKRARLAPYIRAISGDGERVSEWLQKGVFFVDTRDETHDDDGLDLITLHGYDAMLLFEENYPSDSTHDYPMLDVDMVSFIAGVAGIAVDPRTLQIMQNGYMLPLPAGYSQREVLGIIAACYGGNFVISDQGELLLITIGGIPKETNYLIDQTGDSIVFGADLHYEATESGGVVTFDSPAEITALSIDVEPVQDLHGYDSPWPAGGGKNVMPPAAAGSQERYGITVTSDGNGKYTCVGTATDSVNFSFSVPEFVIPPSAERTVCFMNSAAIGTFVFMNGNTVVDTWALSSINRTAGTYYAMANKTCNRIRIDFGRGTTVNMTFSPMFLAKNEDTSVFVPYSNECPISGWDAVSIWNKPTHDTSADPTVTIQLGQTVYGGTLDVTGGKMYAKPYYFSYNGETLVGPWISSMDAYTTEATPTVGAQVVDMGGAETEITLTPTQIATLVGQNNVWSDAGDVTVTYKVETEAVRILV